MLELPTGVVLENLTVEQRQALIAHELQKWQRSARKKAHVLFGKSLISLHYVRHDL